MLQPKTREQIKAERDILRQAMLAKHDSIVQVNQAKSTSNLS